VKPLKPTKPQPNLEPVSMVESEDEPVEEPKPKRKTQKKQPSVRELPLAEESEEE